MMDGVEEERPQEEEEEGGGGVELGLSCSPPSPPLAEWWLFPIVSWQPSGGKRAKRTKSKIKTTARLSHLIDTSASPMQRKTSQFRSGQ